MNPSPPTIRLCPPSDAVFTSHVVLKDGDEPGQLVMVESSTGLLEGVVLRFGDRDWVVRHPLRGMEDVWVAGPIDS